MESDGQATGANVNEITSQFTETERNDKEAILKLEAELSVLKMKLTSYQNQISQNDQSPTDSGHDNKEELLYLQESLSEAIKNNVVIYYTVASIQTYIYYSHSPTTMS